MSGERITTDVDDFLNGVLVSQDPLVKGVISLYVRYGYADSVERDVIRDILEQRIVRSYDVRPEFASDVFDAVEQSAKQEMEAHGAA